MTFSFSTCQVSAKFHSADSEYKSKMSQPIRGQGGDFVSQIGPKNTHLVKNVYFVFPVKSRHIPFSNFREIEIASANQWSEWPCFPIGRKH